MGGVLVITGFIYLEDGDSREQLHKDFPPQRLMYIIAPVIIIDNTITPPFLSQSQRRVALDGTFI